MSTGKIGRTLNPRSKVTPGYTSNPEKQEVKKHELSEKIEEAVTLIQNDLKPLVSIMEEQSKLIEKLLKRLDNVDTKQHTLEEHLIYINTRLSSIESKVTTISENTDTIITNADKKDVVEDDKKGWFR